MEALSYIIFMYFRYKRVIYVCVLHKIIAIPLSLSSKQNI